MDIIEAIEQADGWHRSEFVARCAMAVLPLFDKAWPNAVPERNATVERTIQLTLLGTQNQLMPPELPAARLECRIVAGKALRPLNPEGSFPLNEPAPSDADSCRLAHYVASCAAWAADSLDAGDEMSPRMAIYAFGFAIDAVESAQNMQIQQSLESLIVEFMERDLS